MSATSSSIGLDSTPTNPLSSAPAVSKPIAGLDKGRADAHLERARAALAGNELRTARVAVREALKAHPGLMYLYRELGLVLADLGLDRAAEQCFRGTLPELVADEWFADRHTVAAPPSDAGEAGVASVAGDTRVPWRDVERHVCHAPRTRPMTPPRGIVAPTDRMFARTSMTSSLAVVDRVPDGTLWFDGFNRVVLDGAEHLIERHTRGTPALIKAASTDARRHRIDGRAFFVGNRGYNNYYHWMLDILPSMQLFADAGFEFGADDRVVVFTGASRFHKATLAHLGFGGERIVEMSRTAPRISASELVVPFYENAMGVKLGEWIPAFLKKRFLDDAPTNPAPLPSMPKLYLARASDARNGRSIENEAEMIALLESRGFTTLYPENHGVLEQARIFAAADTVLAPHGAGLTNIAFCRPGTKVVELYGNFIAHCYFALSEVCGLDYYNHCCSTTERAIDYHERSQKDLHALRQRGFSVDLDELAALLDVVERG